MPCRSLKSHRLHALGGFPLSIYDLTILLLDSVAEMSVALAQQCRVSGTDVLKKACRPLDVGKHRLCIQVPRADSSFNTQKQRPRVAKRSNGCHLESVTSGRAHGNRVLDERKLPAGMDRA